MTATLSPSNQAGDEDRGSYFDRLRVRLHCRRLDQRLAEGADPAGDRELRRRAAELTHGPRRLRIAAVLDRILAEAEGPAAPFDSKAPLARDAIRGCAPEIQQIIGTLEADGAVEARGVARVALLIREGSSPLYVTATTEADLRRDLSRTSAEILGA